MYFSIAFNKQKTHTLTQHKITLNQTNPSNMIPIFQDSLRFVGLQLPNARWPCRDSPLHEQPSIHLLEVPLSCKDDIHWILRTPQWQFSFDKICNPNAKS